MGKPGWGGSGSVRLRPVVLPPVPHFDGRTTLGERIVGLSPAGALYKYNNTFLAAVYVILIPISPRDRNRSDPNVALIQISIQDDGRRFSSQDHGL